MDILKRSLIHDIEIFPNFFSDIFKVPGENRMYITGIFNDIDLSDIPFNLKYLQEQYPEYTISIWTVSQTLENLKKFKPYLLGYNSYHYDDIIWKHILKNPKITNGELYKLSKKLVEGNMDKLKYDEKIIKTIDLMRVSGCDRLFKPLKQTASNLKHELIQDLPKPFDELVEINEIVDILKYELNDVFITEKLLLGIPEHQKSVTIPKTAYKGLLPAIEFRRDIGKQFNTNLLNSNKSNIGKKLSSHMYSEISGLEYKEFKDLRTSRDTVEYQDIIFDNVKFKTPELQLFLEKLKSTVFNFVEYNKIKPTDTAKKKKFKIENGLYHELHLFENLIVFATGGIHGVHSSTKVFKSAIDLILKDLDASSYYPYLYWKYGLKPEHLEYFTEFVSTLITTRMKYKKEGNKVYANGLKIAINMIFGSGSDNFSWLKDEKFLLSITINGQLLLLMLAEELYLNDIKPFYFNTDGISVALHPKKLPKLQEIWKQWEKDTKMELEDDDFKECYIRDVNNFLIIKESGGVKYKGEYEYSSYIEKYGEFDVTGSFDMPIVSYAVSEFLTKGIPIEKTIKSHDDIYDFCVAKKTGKQFKNHLFELNGTSFKEEIIQQSIRFYISNSNTKIYKVKEKSETEILNLLSKNGKNKINEYFISYKNKPYKNIYTFKDNKKVYVIENTSLFLTPFKEWLSYSDVCSKENITLFNEYFEHNQFSDYNIKYEYYIKEAHKLIKSLDTNVVKSHKVLQKTLF
ncbi:MAG: hypothetical protein GY775_16685 [Candidatus Scalindua sp.]|nr:hypothetical protein [Candidatus Scalindua sp.]